MGSLTPFNADAFFAQCAADPLFYGGGGSGGGGPQWGTPTVLDVIAGFTHTYWTDGAGNQKHTVADANGNVIQAAAAANVVAGTVATLKWKTGGMVNTAQTVALDKAQIPPGAPPWKLTQFGGATIVGHANNSAVATGNDASGSPYQITYGFGGSATASMTSQYAGGTGSWTLPIAGSLPQLELDLWALLCLLIAMMCVALAFVALPIEILIMIFLIVLAGISWLVNNW